WTRSCSIAVCTPATRRTPRAARGRTSPASSRRSSIDGARQQPAERLLRNYDRKTRRRDVPVVREVPRKADRPCAASRDRTRSPVREPMRRSGGEKSGRADLEEVLESLSPGDRRRRKLGLDVGRNLHAEREFQIAQRFSQRVRQPPVASFLEEITP